MSPAELFRYSSHITATTGIQRISLLSSFCSSFSVLTLSVPVYIKYCSSLSPPFLRRAVLGGPHRSAVFQVRRYLSPQVRGEEAVGGQLLPSKGRLWLSHQKPQTTKKTQTTTKAELRSSFFLSLSLHFSLFEEILNSDQCLKSRGPGEAVSGLPGASWGSRSRVSFESELWFLLAPAPLSGEALS